MTTPQIKPNLSGSGSLFNWRWAALLAVLACLMAGSATAGTLTVTRFSFGSALPFNLSAESDIDWAKWGNFTVAEFDHKAGVTSVIPNYTSIGPEIPFSIGPAQGPLYLQSWLDGTIDKIQNGNQGGLGVNQTAGQSGFQLVIPASTTTQYLFLYAGRAGGGAYQLEASLSDGSAVSVTNAAASLQSRFTIAFAANSAGQTLTIRYYGTTVGSVRLFAAAMASGATLPLSCAAPKLNSPSTVQAGSTIGLLANPKGVNSDASSASAFAYQWQVDGVNISNGTNNPLNNIAVGSVGVHNDRVVVTNSVLGGAAVTSAPVALTVVAAVGTLSAAGVDLPALTPTALDVNLTTEGVIDWAHWGTTGPGIYDTKANIIGDFTQIGSGAFAQFNSTITYTWTDGTTVNPAMTAWNIGTGLPVTNGYVLNIPASSASNRLAQIYVGVAGANMHLEASISDNNAPVFIDDPTIVNGTRRYSIMYKAASAGQTLNVRLTEPQRVTSAAASGGISLQSASLAPVPALSVSALTVSPGTTVLAGQPMVVSIPPLQPHGVPPFTYQWQRNTGTGYTNIPGATASSVSFNAGSPGSESCQVVITNSQGSITSTPVVLTVGAASGIITLLTREAQGTYNLTAEGGLDWEHWGLGGDPGLDQKATGGNKIGAYIEVGTGFAGQFGNAPGVYQWHDGTPTTASTNTTAVYKGGIGHGFELDIQAAQTNRVLHINVGSFSCIAHVEASLSDGSALQFVDETLPSGTSARYNIEYRAGSAGQTLIFKIWDINNSGGNVTLESVSMEAVPPLTASLPVIMPASTVAVGSTIQIQELATGLAPLQYSWQLNSGTGFTNIPSSNVSTLTTSVGVVGSKNYRVVVSDLTGSVTSAPVTLTVTAATSTLVASSTTVENGSTIDLSGE
jgi:hypothetical protein